MKTETFDKLRDARETIQMVERELRAFVASMDHLGLNRSADTLDLLADGLNDASRKVDEGSREALTEHVRATEQATGNMVRAVIASVTQPV